MQVSMTPAMQKIRDEFADKYIFTQNGAQSKSLEEDVRAGFDKCYEIMSARELRLVEALKFYANRENWEFSKSLPTPHIGIIRLNIKESDKEIGLLCEGHHDDVGGRLARKTLEELERE